MMHKNRLFVKIPRLRVFLRDIPYFAGLFTKMNYWLVKSEPSVYSWEQFLKDGKTCWDGVRNYAARMHLNGMKKGDLVMYYHSREGLEVVGTAKVVKESYPDPTTDDDRWVAVDLKPHKSLKKPVPLSEMKKVVSPRN